MGHVCISLSLCAPHTCAPVSQLRWADRPSRHRHPQAPRGALQPELHRLWHARLAEGQGRPDPRDPRAAGPVAHGPRARAHHAHRPRCSSVPHPERQHQGDVQRAPGDPRRQHRRQPRPQPREHRCVRTSAPPPSPPFPPLTTCAVGAHFYPGVSSWHGADTRYYWKLSRHIIRYNHKNAGDGQASLPSGIHTVNERKPPLSAPIRPTFNDVHIHVFPTPARYTRRRLRGDD